jgi:hypothetical protein
MTLYIRKSMDKNNRRLHRVFGRMLIDIMILQAVYIGMDMIEGVWIQWIHEKQRSDDGVLMKNVGEDRQARLSKTKTNSVIVMMEARLLRHISLSAQILRL